MSTIKERWQILDDGTRTQEELVEILGCSSNYVTHLREEWIREQNAKATDGKKRCKRCEFFFDERVPHIRDGLCLWCVLDEAGIDHRWFYESGEWQNWVDWRPGKERTLPKMLMALREAVKEKKEQQDHTYTDAARIAGCGRTTIRRFVEYRNRKFINASTMTAVCTYLGIEPTAKGVAEHFDIHPRRVSMYVVGW